MAQNKTIWDHMNDFYDGIKSTPEALYFFGDYLARVSGFRDWQRDHESVLPIDYAEQSNALAESQAVYDVLSTEPGRKLIFDALKHDAENRPAYYLANIFSSAAIAKVLNKALASTSIAALKTTGITTDLTHQVIEEIKKEANLSDQEFNQLLDDDILKKKIDNEMGYYINDLYNNFNPNDGYPQTPTNPDDGATPQPLEVSVSNASLDEANANMTFTVTLTGKLKDGESLTVNFATADASATGGVDYGNVAKSVTFTNDSLTQTIEVPIYDDPYKESDENFYLTPVSSWGYNGDKTIEFVNAGTGTIIDNDQTDGQVVIEVGSTSADEGDTGIQSTNVTVSISSKLSQDLIVDLSSGDRVTISAGSTSTTAKVAWGSDIVVDSDAPIEVSVTDFYYFGDENVVTGHNGRVTIIDDDNGNGTVEQGELKSLKDEGVKSINVTNVINTNIELGVE